MNRKVLSDWVKLQIAYERSGRILARKLGVNQENIRDWRDERIAFLTEASIEKLARYRGETKLQTRAWVTGVMVEDYIANELRGLPRDLLVRVFKRIQEFIEAEEYLSSEGTSSSTLDTVLHEEGGDMADDSEKVPIGAGRHVRLRAILIASLEIEGMAEASNEAIALAMGYDPDDERRFRSAKNLIYRLLRASDSTIKALADYHVQALARYCHRLIRFENFTAVCSIELTYGKDIDRLLVDISWEGINAK